jgi:toxin ParE1/3/4
MKTLTVRLREAAIADLDEIAGFIAKKSSNPAVASQFINRIRLRCESIGNAPFGGVVRPDLGDGLRMVPFEHSAVIIYQVIEDAVEIINVFYGGRDYAALMRDKSE